MNAPLPARVTLLNKLSTRFAVDETKLLTTLKATAFKVKDGVVSDEQMTALMVVADQYGLNPFTKELFAFPDKQNGIVPVVSVDGWARIINEHGALNGIEFRYAEKIDTPAGGKPCPEWCEVVIHRTDRSKPIVVREYLDEVYRAPFKSKEGYEVKGPWQSHTKRFLRHKTLIQGARIAFGFGGIYDEDEAQRIIEADHATIIDGTATREPVQQPKSKSATPAATPSHAQPGAADPAPAGNAPESNGGGAAGDSASPMASPGMIKNIRMKLKALAGALGQPDEAQLTDDLLVAHEIKALDGITVELGNKILAWIKSKQPAS